MAVPALHKPIGVVENETRRGVISSTLDALWKARRRMICRSHIKGPAEIGVSSKAVDDHHLDHGTSLAELIGDVHREGVLRLMEVEVLRGHVQRLHAGEQHLQQIVELTVRRRLDEFGSLIDRILRGAL